MLYPNAKPNIVHRKLAQWEKEGKLLAVVTQNIDGLHQMAGSQNVYELHGSVHRNTCQKCGARYTLEELLTLGDVPKCPKCGEQIGITVLTPDAHPLIHTPIPFMGYVQA